ncbi:MAG: alkaline phosphatase family protein [Nocardiaceae bacterium]|nr:alkaline phosphatase family protein [Nocardiaceae bacterium]
MEERGATQRQFAVARRAVRAIRPSWPWLAGVLRSFTISFVSLALTLQLVPGTQVPERKFTAVMTLVVTILLVGALLRPLLVKLTVLTGAVGLLMSGFLTQALILSIALALVPSIEPIALPEVIAMAWIVTIFASLLNWIVDASTEEVFFSQIMRRAIRVSRRTKVTGPGLLVVQLDGVAQPLIRYAAASGAIPFLSSLLRSGSHTLRSWHTGLPATTPAGQARLLHGKDVFIPSFRWFDKEHGRMLVANRPADARLIEERISDGKGLLAAGGASISNVFTGDAPFRALTMGKIEQPGNEPGAAGYAAARAGFVRSFVLFAGQVITEWYQARRQRRRGVVPRVSRNGAFLVLRGLTTVILKDLSVSIVADQMARGTPVIYVDLLDYDELAHHAGPTRPESMRTLEGLDRVLKFFHDLAEEVGRDYEIVILSDHGQTQGATFLQLEGRTILDAVREFVDADVAGVRDTDESFGSVQRLRLSGNLTPAPLRRTIQRAGSESDAEGTQTANIEVAVSGSLANLYFADYPGRLKREEVEAIAPGLLPGLRSLKHVGAIITRTANGTLFVENGGGWRELTEEGARYGEGADPLLPYGYLAPGDLLQLDTCANVGDVIILGRYDPNLGEVAAFEELVGSHGGLGGWQTEALFVHPSEWEVDDILLSGTDIYRLLVNYLEKQGLREPDVDSTPVKV